MNFAGSQWSAEEHQILVTAAAMHSASEVAKRLGRTDAAVRTYAARNGVKFSRQARWTKEELDFLEANSPTMMAKQIAFELNRSTQSVLNKAAHEGIRFGQNTKFSAEDVELCRALRKEGLPVALIAEKMEIPVGTVRSYVYNFRRLNKTTDEK